MQDFVDMAEAHAWTLQRLREMAGRLTEQAYLRASEVSAQAPEDAQRWMLVFDKMARGLRLTMALEAKLARERRWDADEIHREAQGDRHAPRWRNPATPVPTAPAAAEPRESDVERDHDGLPGAAPIGERIARLAAILERAAAAEPATGLNAAELFAHEGEPWDRAFDALTAAWGTPPQPPPWRGSG